MFWAKEEEENSLMRLLKSDNFTLEDVLLNEFVVQESRYGKAELVKYITKKENMVALLNLSLNPTIDPDLPMKQQYRLSFIASEILTIRGTDVFQSLIVTCDETKQVMIDFINDERPLTHLVAGFFAKIVECLLSRQFALAFELLQSTSFFDKCLKNINLGAIECLLENLVRIPNNSEGTNTVKQWMIDENLFEKMVDRMSVSENDDDKECIAEVYGEILRELRDKLYMVESKEDALHDKAMDENLIAKIADNLLIDENCTMDELTKKSALISSSAKILDTYLKTNFVLNAPGQHLDEIERNLLEERHYSYGLMRPCLENDAFEKTYQPDPERIVEGIVANRALNIFKTIHKDIEGRGFVWQPLLRLIVEVCNTNHFSTHEKLTVAMKNLPFVNLINLAKKLPRASVLHSLIVRIVALILHSQFSDSRETISPAAEFLITDGSLVKNVYDTACSFHPATDLISSCGLRSFNQNLGDTIFRAKKSSLATPQLVALLNKDSRWSELEDIILNYNSKNRPQVHRDFNDSSLLTSSLRNDSHGFNDSEEWQDASTKFAELDATSSTNKRGFGSFGFEANLQRFSELDVQFDDTPDEDEFKKLCSERANSSSCSGGRANLNENELKWPGEDTAEGVKQVQQEPSVVHNIPSPKVDDMWADFSSFSTAGSSTSSTANASAAAWPGADSSEPGENSDWPLSSSHDSKPSDPNCIGLAATISLPGEKDCSEA